MPRAASAVADRLRPVGELGDSFRAFKGAFKEGPSEPGSWGEAEKFGRFQGTGEVSAEIQLPGGPLAVSAEDYPYVENLELELTGPSGGPIEVKRYSKPPYGSRDALRNLHRIATAKIVDPGHHQLRVKAPDAEESLLITVGEDLTPGGALKDFAGRMIPGARLWKRLRGE
jgi:hypothetical protein